eukprot:EG_transcript_36415
MPKIANKCRTSKNFPILIVLCSLNSFLRVHAFLSLFVPKIPTTTKKTNHKKNESTRTLHREGRRSDGTGVDLRGGHHNAAVGGHEGQQQVGQEEMAEVVGVQRQLQRETATCFLRPESLTDRHDSFKNRSKWLKREGILHKKMHSAEPWPVPTVSSKP